MEHLQGPCPSRSFISSANDEQPRFRKALSEWLLLEFRISEIPTTPTFTPLLGHQGPDALETAPDNCTRGPHLPPGVSFSCQGTWRPHVLISKWMMFSSVLHWLNVQALGPDGCCCSVTKSCPTLWPPWTVARQAPLSSTISHSLLLDPNPKIHISTTCTS